VTHVSFVSAVYELSGTLWNTACCQNTLSTLFSASLVPRFIVNRCGLPMPVENDFLLGWCLDSNTTCVERWGRNRLEHGASRPGRQPAAKLLAYRERGGCWTGHGTPIKRKRGTEYTGRGTESGHRCGQAMSDFERPAHCTCMSSFFRCSSCMKISSLLFSTV